MTIELKKPDSSLLESFSSVKLGFLSPASLKKGDTLCDASRSLVGTGPFTIDRYTRGQSVRPAKNPRYDWPPGYSEHRGPAYLNTVTHRFAVALAVSALRGGRTDTGVPGPLQPAHDATPRAGTQGTPKKTHP
ncbi:ABC transporter substrate-binding protein [Streptomyces sp. MK37H]|uniref:ABC transporter substrate-binding protein n=1 Tax=Streptomyces sp. MK37H TaxID=2699117 RepID=UPI001B36C5DC|nr:ABC transporter substrate-binding protein [Streptomyces sp. MK37H]MBP8534611.1 hypothetical protein [Streptomyces sp. MK37H]